MEWPVPRHPLHVANWRQQVVPEEGHLAKPAWAEPSRRTQQHWGIPGEAPGGEEPAKTDRSARGGREGTGPEEEEGPRPTPSLARGIPTESSPEAALWCSGSALASHARGPGFNSRAG